LLYRTAAPLLTLNSPYAIDFTGVSTALVGNLTILEIHRERFFLSALSG
jgi:hypothetical protein